MNTSYLFRPPTRRPATPSLSVGKRRPKGPTHHPPGIAPFNTKKAFSKRNPESSWHLIAERTTTCSLTRSFLHQPVIEVLASISPSMAHHDPIADAKAQEATHKYVFRPATMDDIPALQQMIGESLRALGKGYYTDAELDGSIGFLFGPDTVLIVDE